MNAVLAALIGAIVSGFGLYLAQLNRRRDRAAGQQADRHETAVLEVEALSAQATEYASTRTAREGLIRDRRRACYREVVAILVEWRAQLLEVNGPSKDFRVPRRLQASLELHGSNLVRSYLARFADQVADVRVQQTNVQRMLQDDSLDPVTQERRHRTTFTREMRALDASRRSGLQTLETAIDLMRSELAD